MLSSKLRPGPGIIKLMEPGRVCSEEKNCCGWIVIRRRRKQYYVYLLSEDERDCYLGPLSRFKPSPVRVIINVDYDRICVDVETIPDNAEGLIGVVKGLAQLHNNMNLVEEIVERVLTKYKLVRG